MDNTIQWELFRDLSDSKICHAWDIIAEHGGNLAYYQQKAWYESLIASDFISPNQLYFLLFSVDKVPAGIVPLTYGSVTRFGLKMRSWQTFGAHDLGVNDAIINQSITVPCLIDELISALTQLGKPWDLLALQDCPQEGVIDTAIKQCKPRRNISIYHHDSKRMVCRDTEDNTLNKLSAKHRKNIKRLENKLKKEGEVTDHYYRNLHDLEQAFEEFLQVEAAGWKGEGMTALMHDAPLLGKYRDLIKFFGANGQCVIHTLKLNSKAVASQFAIISGDTYYMLKIGYDEAYKASGPGTVLLEKTIQHFSEEDGVNHISFITGAVWQDRWLPETTEVFQHFVYNNSVKGQTGYISEVLKNRLRAIKHRFTENRK